MKTELKPKACKNCKSRFTPTRPMQNVCGPMCGLEKARKKRERDEAKAKAQDKKETRAKLEGMKTIPDLIKEAQHAFNAYIRLRDQAKSCICCGKPYAESNIGGSYDCGHYRSVGSASHLRFNEDNAHGQRKYCNQWGAGRAVDYRIGLIQRIGLERVEALENNNTPKKWTREELREIKATYTAKARELQKGIK